MLFDSPGHHDFYDDDAGDYHDFHHDNVGDDHDFYDDNTGDDHDCDDDNADDVLGLTHSRLLLQLQPLLHVVVGLGRQLDHLWPCLSQTKHN